MNIAQLLREYAKSGDKFYCTLYGDVKLSKVIDESSYECIYLIEEGCGDEFTLNYDGTWNSLGECVIFPSCDQRDWQKWKEIKESQPDFRYKVGDHVLFDNQELGVITEANPAVFTVHYVKDDDFVEYENRPFNNLKKIDHFDYNLLKIFDPVLVRDAGDLWGISHFSHIDDNGIYCENKCKWDQCIPLNSETKKLHNTSDKAPEFYNVKI